MIILVVLSLSNSIITYTRNQSEGPQTLLPLINKTPYRHFYRFINAMEATGACPSDDNCFWHVNGIKFSSENIDSRPGSHTMNTADWTPLTIQSLVYRYSVCNASIIFQ